jgi:tRNA pseudouridine13 synthase
MRYKVQPEDFIVEEQIRLPLARRGPFAVYRVRKRGLTTLGVQARMARALGVSQSDVVFPALKDKEAVAVQHAAVRGTGPARLSFFPVSGSTGGDALPSASGGMGGVPRNGFEAELLGRSPRPLTPADIVANRFTLVLRDMPIEEATRVRERLVQVARFGLPNYFDQQRFGSLTPGEEHIGKHILQRDAEGALHAYLAQPFVGDPAPVRKFKTFATAHWGDWDGLFEAAPRPSNFRSVLTYLRDHPTGAAAERTTHYRKALNLITRRLLSLYLAAYQSLLWNRIAARYLVARMGEASARVEVAGERLPVYYEPPASLDPDIAIPLPNHRAVYANPELATVVAQVLAEEGLALNDLKARILKKAYLPKGKRALMFFPEDASASPPEPDDRFPGRHKATLTFTLSRGSYATLVIKALAA